MINRFSVKPLSLCVTILSDVASFKKIPDLVITNCNILSVYTDMIINNKEVWISNGRIAAIRNVGDSKKYFQENLNTYNAKNGIIAPGLIDPHMHIESSMMTACAYSEAAL